MVDLHFALFILVVVGLELISELLQMSIKVFHHRVNEASSNSKFCLNKDESVAEVAKFLGLFFFVAFNVELHNKWR